MTNTPSTAFVRNQYRSPVDSFFDFEEFDAWLASVKAEAWTEAINHIEPYLHSPELKRAAHADNPYRAED